MSQSTFSNTQTGGQPADPYKAKNIEEVPLKEKVEDLVAFAKHCKFGMMTTNSHGFLVSRCMALADTEGGGVDLIFHTNTESGKTDELHLDPKTNISFLNPTGEWASISGEASIVTDRATVQKYYSETLKAWLGDLGDGVHDGGPEDPRIGIIKVKAHTVTYCISRKGIIGSSIEFAKGLVKGDVPVINKIREISVEELQQWRQTSGQ
ncbi:putative BLI-3 blue-light-inducible Bli-3 protein [Xylona heveae TC161]|uniref:Putative BLI-3 blue-light-inducible Bli-3 protein n=1 Tax=Xylona heveae (strain CBS 132557 / TC161) TaxID=1328760 RepID=A0A165IPK2_XYLHT|nr:putative BLI-3 blue-light-inducible Bli-3 protein [Xylona heveae TC161]KZF25194.1 putative BLI-3 blue-light-inducible Bli-3 protein [Xylona heveae TC161]